MKYKIGVTARSIRISKGIKQSYVSEKLGFKYSSNYAEIEAGKKGLTADKVPALAEALDVSIEELFFDKNVHES